jgi:hypothetical protein
MKAKQNNFGCTFLISQKLKPVRMFWMQNSAKFRAVYFKREVHITKEQLK